jgi:hypothetical protein
MLDKIIIIIKLSELLGSHANAYSMYECKSFRNRGLIPENPTPGNEYPIRSESYSYDNESPCCYLEVSLPQKPIINPYSSPKPHHPHPPPHHLQSVSPPAANVQEYANIQISLKNCAINKLYILYIVLLQYRQYQKRCLAYKSQCQILTSPHNYFL